MRGMMGNHIIEDHLVPANRAGLVIGKGGETIKQINAQSGAHAEIVKNPPAGSDPNYKQFTIKGFTLKQFYKLVYTASQNFVVVLSYNERLQM